MIAGTTPWPRVPSFGRLKEELGSQVRYQDAGEAWASVFVYLEGFWNRERRHSTLGYVSPNDYEQTHNSPPAKTLSTFQEEGQ